MVSTVALEKLQSAYRHWNSDKGSTAEPLFDLMSDDLKFRSIAGGAPDMAFTRPHSNKEQVKAYFTELARDWQMIFYHVRAFIASGDTVAVVCECSWRHKRTGKVVHSPKLDIVRFKGDKIADFFEFFDTEQAIEACRGQADVENVKLPKPLYRESGAEVVQGESDESRRNLDLLRKIYQEWHDTKGKSVQKILDILAPDVSWGSLAQGAENLDFTRHSLSKQQVADYFQGLANGFEMNFYRPDEFLAAGDFVLMIGTCSFKNKATGKTFTTPKADLWRFRDGKAVEFFEYYDTAGALASTR